MGCGASKDPKVAVADSKQNYNKSSSQSYNNQNGFRKVELKNTQDSYNQYNRPSSEKSMLLAYLHIFNRMLKLN